MITGLALLLKGAQILSVLIALGLSLHYLTGISSKLGRRYWVFPLAIIAIGILRLLILNAQLSGSLAGAFDLDTAQWVWSAQGLHFKVLCVGALTMIAGAKYSRILLGVAVSLVSLSFGLTGHVYGLSNPGIFPILVALHMIVAAFWFVAPISLWPRDKSIIFSLRRFSQIAVWSVPVLFITGSILLYALMGDLTSLWTTGYGRILMIKIAMAVGLLILGACNKLYITNLVHRVPESGMRYLRVSLSLEGLLFFGVLISITIATTIVGPHG